ncbi:MAG: amidohydrolase family protein [Sphingomicrobium sp.]
MAIAVAPLVAIDAHQHFWPTGKGMHTVAYQPHHYLAEAENAGVRITATVFVECFAAYDYDLPSDLQSTGETKFAASIGDAHEHESTRLAAAIIAHADPFTAARPYEDILAALDAAAAGRLRAIRRSVAWDEDDTLNYAALRTGPGQLLDQRLRRAACLLAERNLAFETWLYHPQLGELAVFADTVPNCVIMLDHAGTPVGSGRYAERDVYPEWRDNIARLAERPNVLVKIGGLVTPGTAIDRDRIARGLTRWTRSTLAEALSPWVNHLFAHFGAERCVFESNFPVDGAHCDLAVLIGAYLDLTSRLSNTQRAAVMGINASRLYDIPLHSTHSLKE